MNMNALGIIFSNMHDEALHEITAQRTMASIPFGGRYRLIDFALSNMHNSGVTNVGVITKSNYQSLMDHLGSGKEWDLSRKRGGLFIFPPFGRSRSGFYKSRIEALSGIMAFIQKSKHDYVIMTDCNVICNMDWDIPLAYHIKKKADITVLYCRKGPNRGQSNDEVVYTVSPDGLVKDMLINQEIHGECNVGMNMWIMGKNFLEHMIEEAVVHNLENMERDLIQRKIGEYKIFGWEYEGYIGKINSMSDLFDVNMDILKQEIRGELFYKYGHIYTKVRDEVPAKYGESALVSNSLIADGCVIEGEVENSILFRGVHIGKGTKVSNSIIMQGSKIGDNVLLNYIIADKDVHFKDNRMMMGYDLHPTYIGKGSMV